MEIKEFEFAARDQKTGIVGMNISSHNERPFVNIFDLDTNAQGKKADENFWGVSRQILDVFFQGGKKRQDVNWAFINNVETRNVNFQECKDLPFKLSVEAIENEKHQPGRRALSLEEYQSTYNIFQGRAIPKEDIRNFFDIPVEGPTKEIYAVPCVKAEDGVFYCKPEMYMTEYSAGYEFLAADTSKLFELMQRSGRDILQTAEEDFPDEWVSHILEGNSFAKPRKISTLSINENSHENGAFTASMNGNPIDSAILSFAARFNLPFLPVQLSMVSGKEKNAEIKRQIGYMPE